VALKKLSQIRYLVKICDVHMMVNKVYVWCDTHMVVVSSIGSLTMLLSQGNQLSLQILVGLPYPVHRIKPCVGTSLPMSTRCHNSEGLWPSSSSRSEVSRKYIALRSRTLKEFDYCLANKRIPESLI
jgi:hypothetical protein